MTRNAPAIATYPTAVKGCCLWTKFENLQQFTVKG